MGSNRATAENPQNEPTVQGTPQTYGSAPEHGLKIRIQNLDALVHSVLAALDRESFEGKHEALNVIANLRVKIKATLNMFRLASLLREPARESMLLRVHDSLLPYSWLTFSSALISGFCRYSISVFSMR
jgi:hypothetical protein